MAFSDTTAPFAGAATSAFLVTWRVVSAPFRGFLLGLIAMAEASDRMEQVRELNEMTDDDLARRGTTRADEVRRIFASCGVV